MEWEKGQIYKKKMYEGRREDICNPICPKISTYLKTNQSIHYSNLYNNPLLNSKLAEEINLRKIHLKSGPIVFNFSNSNICNLSCIMYSQDYKDEKIPDFISFADSYKFSAGFQRIRGVFGKQNIFEMKDADALEKLRKIMINEQAKKRDIYVRWGDLQLLTQGKHKEKEKVA